MAGRAWILALLVACGGGKPATEDLTAQVPDVGPHGYVDAARGDDAGPGTTASPWKTISHAITTLSTGGTIHVAPGTYGAGETFPLRPLSNQVLVGNVATLGADTEIDGSGDYAMKSGVFTAEIAVTVLFAPGVTGAQLNGFSFGAGVHNAILVDGATVLCDSDSTSGKQTNTAIQVANGGHLTVTNGSFSGGTGALGVVDPESSVRARGTIFGQSSMASISLGTDAPPTAVGTIDLGTSTDPGLNTIDGGPGTVGLEIFVAGPVILAAGNVWHASVQGTDANGHYRAALATGVLPMTIGNNYSSFDAKSQMQF